MEYTNDAENRGRARGKAAARPAPTCCYRFTTLAGTLRVKSAPITITPASA